ncbi:unnamed protein product [Ambrosiozyma monospora]|uniref:Unnamed protein product n=1 Tax=Ambrosiozyma monospora TaxID=43982 RepID=A0ACB5TEU5_AMBMO|nr:unnamed protein product [Ambrosiozyma monospora]
MSKDDSNLLTQLSKEQIHTFKAIFNLIDQDHDNKISVKDLKTTIVNIGIDNIDDDAINDMIPDGQTEINFNSFLKIMNNKFGTFSGKHELTQAFAAFNEPQSTKTIDNINSKKLSKSLLETEKKSSDLNITKSDIEKVIKEFTDTNELTGNKTFSAEKFIDTIHN